eukprot:COSAG02_NODE_66670_length_255_cov_0.371795_1_plen_31_part_01
MLSLEYFSVPPESTTTQSKHSSQSALSSVMP